MSRNARPSSIALAAALCLAPAWSCSQAGDAAGAAAERAWPAGTVLAVEDLPITAEEVDVASVWVEPIDRKASSPHLRRLALTNVVLPRKVARLLAEPGAYERALAEAQRTLEALRAGTWTGPPGPEGTWGEPARGTFQALGLPVWGTALGLAEGEWSEPIEDAGRIVLVRRLRTHPGAVPLATEVELDLFAFDYLAAEGAALAIERAYDRLQLSIVDPAWRELVPELLQYRMGVHQP